LEEPTAFSTREAPNATVSPFSWTASLNPSPPSGISQIMTEPSSTAEKSTVSFPPGFVLPLTRYRGFSTTVSLPKPFSKR
jgi:hypothetical protein